MAIGSAADTRASSKRRSHKRSNKDESDGEEAPTQRKESKKGSRFSTPKITSHFEDSDNEEREDEKEEMQDEEDHADTSDSTDGKKKNQHGEGMHTSPATMRRFCKLVKELRSEKRLEDTLLSAVSVKKVTLDNEDRFDEEMCGAIADLRHFFALANKTSRVRMFKAVDDVETYLNEEPSVVTLHPSFPTKPLPAHTYYMRKATERGMKMTVADAKRAIEKKTNDPLVVECRKEAAEAERDYAKKLKDFLKDNRENILSHQVPFVNKLIRREEDKKSKREPVVSKSKKAAKKTSFEIYVEREKKKYFYLDEEEAEEKLREDFQNLTELEHQLLNELAGKE